MRDEQCVEFLQWALPRLDKRWRGFCKVRGQVCKRITRRMQELQLNGLASYRLFLKEHPDEWDWLDAACRITISRFYRDRRVFDILFEEVLPTCVQACQQRDDTVLPLWSAGCASGEEPYTLSIGWEQVVHPHFPDLALHITATDAQEHMLGRARQGCYSAGTLKELPDAWVEAAFHHHAEREEPYCLKDHYRTPITWKQQDIRKEMPEGPFEGILCRNLVFMYFNEDVRRSCLQRMVERLQPGGFLVLGSHDVLPRHDLPLKPWFEGERIYRHMCRANPEL